jgi:hypothetical protein
MNPDYPFTTDGCSGGMTLLWRLLFARVPPWEGSCVEHDKWYWRGGSAATRRMADRELMASVTKRGYPFAAFLMYYAVRLGGHPLLPLPWRWGYGWKYPRGYQND